MCKTSPVRLLPFPVVLPKKKQKKRDRHIGADSTHVYSAETERLGPAAIQLCILSLPGKTE